MVMTYSKPAVRNAWADTAVPTTDIVDPGNAFVTEGWLENTVPPPRQYFNWALNWAAQGVRYFMQTGISTFDPTETYQAGGIVQAGGYLWQSLVGNNTGNSPPPNVSTSTSFWIPLNGYATVPYVIANYVSNSSLATTLASYVTNTSLASTLAAYVTNSSLASTLSSYLTTATAASTYVSNSSLASTLTSYLTKTLAASTYAPLISPSLSGTPTTPTAALATDTTQIASTAFAVGNFLKSTLGYQRFPSGLIIQWGYALSSSGGVTSVSFATAFTVNCYSLTATSSVTQGTLVISDPYDSNTGFTFTNGAVGANTCWMAIGY
jgi:hypothetical protein